MDPATLAAVISGGSAILGTGAQVAHTGKQNRKSRKFSREMYEKQKADNISFWEMQNEYNNPANQMKRLSDAGLNPALMYKQGNTGAASPIKSPDVKPGQFKTADFSGLSGAGSSAVNQYYDTKIKQAQINNLEADNTVKMEEAGLKHSQRLQTEANTRRSIFDYDFESDMRGISASARSESLRQTVAKTDIMLSSEERQVALHSLNMAQAAENILLTRARKANTDVERSRLYAAIKDLKYSTRLKQLEGDLAEKGIFKHDKLWQRMLARFMEKTIKLAPSLPYSNPKFKKEKNYKYDSFTPSKW